MTDRLRAAVMGTPADRDLNTLLEQKEATDAAIRQALGLAAHNSAHHTGFVHIERILSAALEASTPASEPETS